MFALFKHPYLLLSHYTPSQQPVDLFFGFQLTSKKTIYQVQMTPKPVFRVTRELIDGTTSFSNIEKELDDVVDAVDDWRQNGSPQKEPHAGRELHFDVIWIIWYSLQHANKNFNMKGTQYQVWQVTDNALSTHVM